MKPSLRLAIRMLGLALVLGLVTSCATTPAKVKRIEFSDQCDCKLDIEGLEGLMGFAIENPNSEESNHALAHFVERWKVERGNATEGEVGNYRIRFGSGSGPEETIGYYDRISPAVDYLLDKLDHCRREGYGAPLVAIRENRHVEEIESWYPPEGITRALTAVARVEKRTGGKTSVRIDLLSPLRHQNVTVDGERHPLAADFSVPWATLLARSKKLRKSGVGDLLTREPSADDRSHKVRVGIGIASGQVRSAFRKEFEERFSSLLAADL